jgi:hypothetical protein
MQCGDRGWVAKSKGPIFSTAHQRKIHVPFRRHEHTSFICVRSESWEVRPTLFENGLRNGCRNAWETVVL